MQYVGRRYSDKMFNLCSSPVSELYTMMYAAIRLSGGEIRVIRRRGTCTNFVLSGSNSKPSRSWMSVSGEMNIHMLVDQVLNDHKVKTLVNIDVM